MGIRPIVPGSQDYAGSVVGSAMVRVRGNSRGAIVNDYDGVESLMKGLKRPATSYEIVNALSDVKQRRSVYGEIRTLLRNGSLEKIELDVPGFDGSMVVYVRAELLKRNAEVI